MKLNFRQIFQILKLEVPQAIEASRNLVWKIEDNYFLLPTSVFQFSFPISYASTQLLQFVFEYRMQLVLQ